MGLPMEPIRATGDSRADAGQPLGVRAHRLAGANHRGRLCGLPVLGIPANGAIEQARMCERAAKDRSARQIQGGIRVSLFVIAVTFVACGFIVLTEPLAVPFTITMWLGAAMSFMAGVFGNFRSHADGTFRGFLPPRG